MPLVQRDLTSRIDSYWSAISMRWQLPQEKTKSTGCYPFRQPERRHASAELRLIRSKNVQLGQAGDGQVVNEYECW